VNALASMKRILLVNYRNYRRARERERKKFNELSARERAKERGEKSVHMIKSQSAFFLYAPVWSRDLGESSSSVVVMAIGHMNFRLLNLMRMAI
jgi:hypothetical protein